MSGTFQSGTYTETYQFVGEFVDRVTAPADQASVSLDNVGTAATDMGAQVKAATDAVDAGFQKVGASATASARGFNVLQRAIDPLGAQLRVAENNLSRLNTRIAEGGADLNKYASLLPLAISRVDELRKRHDELAQSLKSSAQAALNQTLGIKLPGSDEDYKARAADIQAYGNSLDALRAKFNPVFALSKQYENTLNEIAKAQKVGALSTNEVTAAQEKARLNFVAATQAAEVHDRVMTVLDSRNRQVSQGLRIMSLQWIDLVQGIGSGMPIWQTLVQQGGQVYQVAQLMNVGFRDVGTYLANLVSPGKLAVTSIVAVGAALGAMAIYAESTNRRLGELRAELSASRADFETMAKDVEKSARQVARATTASFKEASEAAQTIGSTRAFTGTQQDLADLTKTAVDLAKVMGTDIPAASKLLAQAMTNPAAALKTLSEGEKPLQTVTVALRLQVDELVRVGKFAEAAKLAVDALKASSSEAPKQMTPLQNALHQLSEALSTVGEDGRSFSKVMGEAFTDAAAAVIGFAAKAINALRDFRDYLAKPSPNVKQSLGIGEVGEFGQVNPTLQMTPGGGISVSNINPTALQYRLQAQFPSLFTQGGSPLLGPNVPGQGQAVGLMQLMPGTYGGLGYSRDAVTSTAGGNLAAGLNYINQLYGGGQRGASEISNIYGGATSPSAQAARASAIGSADISKLPSDVVGGIEFIGQIFGWPDWLIKLAKQTAYVESHGQQFSGGETGGGLGATAPADRRSAAASIYGGGQDEAAAMRGIEAAKDIKLQADEVKRLTLILDDLTAARQKARDDKNVTEEKRLTDAITVQKDAVANAENVLRKETQALQDQAKVAGIVGQANKELAQIYIAAARAREAGRGATDAQVQEQVAALTEKQNSAFKDQNAILDQTIAANNAVAASWENGAVEAAKATAKAEAHKQVMDTLATSTHDVAAAEDERTKKILEAASGQEKLNATKEASQIRDQIGLIQLESQTLGENNDQRALAIQHRKDEIDVMNQYAHRSEEERAAIVANRDALAQSTQALRNQTRDVDTVANSFLSAFDTIGNAITEAFVQGSASAVNFGNVMKSVVSAIIQQFLRLAVINPIINSLFGGIGGQSLPVLGGVLGSVVGGGTGIAEGGTGSSGFGGLLQIGGLASQGYSLFGGGGGLGNIFSGTGFLGSGGAAANFLATPLFGSVSGAATNSALAASGFGIGGAPGVATAGAYTAAGGSIPLTIGGAATGLGLGFGLGSLAGGLLQSSLGKTGPGPMIGAGLGAAGGLAGGALAGAAAGSVVPVIGTIIGAIAGGLLGGALGPKPPSPYSATFVGLGNNGFLEAYPGLSGNQITPSNYQMVANEVSTFNQNLGNLGVRVSGISSPPPAGAAGGLGFFGQAKNPQGLAGASVTDAFSRLRFGAQTTGYGAEETDVLNRALDRTFSSFAELAPVVEKVRTFMERTLPSMRQYGENIGSLQQAINQISAAFNPAIATAHDLGFAEQELTDKRDAQIAKVTEQANAAFAVTQQGYASRFATAAAALSGNSAQVAAANLQAFDLQSNAERKQLTDNLTQTYGDAIKTSQFYADQIVGLDRALAAERLVIIKDADAAILQQQQQAAEQQRLLAEAAAQADVLRGDLNARLAAAQATTPAEITAANLAAFDQQANAQRKQLADQYQTQAYYADLSARLETTLGAERLKIQTAANDQIIQQQQQAMEQAKQTATGLVTSLADYVRGLKFGGQSPLAPNQQLLEASRQFGAVAGAAMAGDSNSFAKLPSYTDAYLSAARTTYGSGLGYATLFQQITDILASVAEVPVDMLTASIYVVETRTQTATLEAAIQNLQNEVAGLRGQLAAGSAMPDRLAA